MTERPSALRRAEPRAWVVDGMNVIGSRPDGWWRDRGGAMRQLTEQLMALHRATGDEVTVVFDGPHRPGVAEQASEGISVLFAHGDGPDAADRRIIDLVMATGEPERLTVATSDRWLAARVSELGAQVVGGGDFRARLADRAG